MTVLASFPAVTDPFSHVSVVCDVVVSDSDCDFVKPQTFVFSPANATRVWRWGCEARMQTELPLVNALPESVDANHAWKPRKRAIIKEMEKLPDTGK